MQADGTACDIPYVRIAAESNRVFMKKGKADHARMGVGGVLISLTLAMSP